MANDSGLNTDEVQAALEQAKAAGDETQVRYLERVVAHRKGRRADVESFDLVLGNKDAYNPREVEQQEDLAKGRPVREVSLDDQSATRGAEGGSPGEPVEVAGDKNVASQPTAKGSAKK